MTKQRFLRLVLACAIGLLAFAISAMERIRTGAGGDFGVEVRAAQLLLAGQNPYFDPELPPQDPSSTLYPLFYPLPAVLLAIPFVGLQPEFAGALFSALSTGLLVFVISGTRPYLLPMIASAPLFWAVVAAQWSVLVTAAALSTWLLPLAILKPSLGLPIAAGFPRKWGLVVAALVLAASLLILPTWPLDMLRNAEYMRAVMGRPGVPPLLITPGVFTLLALLRWRDPMARFLVLFAAMPQSLEIYDGVPAWLVARSWRQSAFMAACSWAGWLLMKWLFPPEMNAMLDATAPWMVGSIFLPALAVVLVRDDRNVAAAGAWARSALASVAQATSARLADRQE